MKIITLILNSKKLIKVLKSLENEIKILSQISEEINNKSNHVSKYLKSL